MVLTLSYPSAIENIEDPTIKVLSPVSEVLFRDGKLIFRGRKVITGSGKVLFHSRLLFHIMLSGSFHPVLEYIVLLRRLPPMQSK